MIFRRPEQIRVREIQLRLSVLQITSVGQVLVSVLGAHGAEIAVVGEEEVEGELDVEGPIAGVVEDEYGVDFDGGRGGVVLVGGGGGG